jgi:hypothetical protein
VAAKSTYDKLATNADGSIDLYFGPTVPSDKENNWIETLPGPGWFAWFRFYGPILQRDGRQDFERSRARRSP